MRMEGAEGHGLESSSESSRPVPEVSVIALDYSARHGALQRTERSFADLCRCERLFFGTTPITPLSVMIEEASI